MLSCLNPHAGNAQQETIRGRSITRLSRRLYISHHSHIPFFGISIAYSDYSIKTKGTDRSFV